jgi:hypothetical protein
MAARHIPRAERHDPRTELTTTITFTNGVPSKAAVIAPSESQVAFALSANSTFTITLAFNPNPPTNTGPNLFSNVTLVPGQAPPAAQSPSDGSLNYNVLDQNGNKIGGPYSIQVGITNASALILQVTFIGSSGDCQPEMVRVPATGLLQMVSTDGHSYGSLSWGSGVNNPFTPPLTRGGLPSKATGPASAVPYVYSVPNAGPTAGNGGGKIIISG